MPPPAKPIIWIVDTSIFLNVLDVPGMNQDRVTVLADFQARIENKDAFLLPFGAILETGNHIVRLNSGGQRKDYAGKFVEQVKQAIDGEAPWRAVDFPEPEVFKDWLNDFPNHAQSNLSLVDHSIIKEWEAQCSRFKDSHEVRIWSTDGGLQGYQC